MSKNVVKAAMLAGVACVLLGLSPLFAATFSAYPLTEERQRELRDRGELAEAIALRDAALTRATRGEFAPSSERVSIGERRALIILVDFDDQPGEYEIEHFDEMLFSEGDYPTGSFRDYYLENSYGQLEMDGDVVGWYRMPENYSYYADNNYGFGDYPRNAQKLVEEAVEAADDDVDFSDYDNDEDGLVDMLIVVHSGVEGAGYRTKLWSHVSGMSQLLLCDGTFVYTYAMCPEFSGIGVYCHEFGHLLGLPDLYDTDYSSTGVGSWTLMASGTHLNGGRTPAHFDAWCKMKLGWIEPIVVEEKITDAEMPAVEREPVIYRLRTDGKTEKQYFLVENRQKTGFDAYLPGEGLLIYHVDDAVRNNRDESHYRVGVEQADGQSGLERGFSADQGDPFPGSTNNRQFDCFSVPNSRDYTDERTYVAVVAISDSGPTMTAHLAVSQTEPELDLDVVKADDQGNGDGVFSPGETVAVRVRVENRGYNANFLTGLLRTDDEHASLASASLTFPAIPKDGAEWSNETAMIDIAPDCPCPHTIEVRIELTSGDFGTILQFALNVCSTYQDTFEVKDVIWRHYRLNDGVDEWHQSSIRNATDGGLRSAKCGAKSRFDDYGKDLDCVLVSPVVGMTEGSTISFMYWIEAETDLDGHGVDVGLVEGTEDGENWFSLEPDGGYPEKVSRAVETPLPPNTPCFTGTTDGFEPVTITCPAGVKLQQFRFRFVTNGSSGLEGWYIDEVRVAPPAGAAPAPVIESGGFMYSQILGPEEMLQIIAAPRVFGDDNAVASVELRYEGVPLGICLNDDGELGDDLAGDGVYSTLFQVPRGILPGQYVLQIVAEDAFGQLSAPWPKLHVTP